MADTTGMTRNAGSLGRDALDRAQEGTGTVVEKAKDMASNVADRAKDLASNVAEKTQGAASAVAHKVEDVASAVGDKASAAASRVADTWQAGSEYVREGVGDMFDELTTLIRRHPVPALLVGFGLGFMLARVIRD